MAITPGGETSAPARRHRTVRFSRYAVISVVTVPVGYACLLLAHHLWPGVNAGLLNVGVGTVLTPPSYAMYRLFVWREPRGRGVAKEMFGFWQTVMVGAVVAGLFIGLVDALWKGHDLLIIAAGLFGQGIVFLARFVWLDLVTFKPGQPGQPGRPAEPGQPGQPGAVSTETFGDAAPRQS